MPADLREALGAAALRRVPELDFDRLWRRHRRARARRAAAGVGVAAALAVVVAVVVVPRGPAVEFEPAAAPPPPTPVEVAERYMDARNAWDAQAAARLLAPDAVLDDVPVMGRGQLVLGFEALRIYEFRFEPFDCAETEPGPSAAVTCRYRMHSKLGEIVDYPPVAGRFEFEVADGRITVLTHRFNFGAYSNVWGHYALWLQREHPGLIDQLYRLEGAIETPILTPESLELQARLLAEFDEAVSSPQGGDLP